MDKELFLKKYEEVYRDMYRYAYFLLGHRQDAEDIVSDAVVDAYSRRGELRDMASFKGWIFTILSRKCSKKRKEYATKKTLSMDGNSDEDEGVISGDRIMDKRAPDPETRAVAESLLNQLEDIDREIILLHALGGYTSEEIGKILKLNAATVRSREHRAIQKLRM